MLPKYLRQNFIMHDVFFCLDPKETSTYNLRILRDHPAHTPSEQ